MVTVLLAFDDVGLAVPLQESLESLGFAVTWDANQRSGPSDQDTGLPDVVLLAEDGDTTPMAERVAAWRAATVPPGILIVGLGEADRQEADRLRVGFFDNTMATAEIGPQLEQAAKLRFACGLEAPSPARVAMRALGLDPVGGDDENAMMVVTQAGKADPEMVREALRWHAPEYIAVDINRIEQLRRHRALSIPEVELVGRIDGTTTLQRVLKSGIVEPWHAARLVWALASVGIASFSPEPPDRSTPARFALDQARFHLRARRRRLASATFYDILEVPPDAGAAEIDRAGAMLALRYSPERLGKLDLSTLTPLVEPLWKQVVEASATLRDPAARNRYNQWLESHREGRVAEWLVDAINVRGAAEALARGQRALVGGEVFRAVSETAAACRLHPGHPDYEASLAYARYRADVQSGKDREAVAHRERAVARDALAGHRPWPHALVALGILAAADQDADAARWHLHEALRCDPNLPAAKQLLQRLKS